MTHGRSIRLFLVDGTPQGLLTAEIMNWTGHVLTGPRSKLSELVKRPECARTGVYFLVGPDPENPLRPLVYVGETDDVGQRLTQHNRPEDQGGKDFWEKVCVVTSKDANLTKAHVKYLESMLMRSAGAIGRCALVNGTNHDYSNLPEADRADMAFFIEQIRTVLPVLGFDFLRERPQPTKSSEETSEPQNDVSPVFRFHLPKHGITARGREYNGEFYVLEGSRARAEWASKAHGYQALFDQLCADGVLQLEQDGLRTFTQDQAFSSPSAASAIAAGRPSNGRWEWKVEETGQSYAEWQDEQVTAAANETETPAP